MQFTKSAIPFRATTLAAASALALLAGCGTTQQMERARVESVDAKAQAHARTQQITDAIDEVRKNGRVDPDEVARPFLAGAAVPLAPEVTLPPALRQGVNTTLLFKDQRRDIMSLAEGITRATGIPVRVKPDALLPMANFLPRAGGAPNGAAAVQNGTSALESNSIELKAEDAPLNTMLDRVASRLALNWRYDGRAIEIYRLESRSFEFKALPVKVATQAGLGRNATQGGAFDNSSNTKYSAPETDPMAAAKAAIEARMTRAGLGPVISPETGTVVVTDTPEALNAIQGYIDRENRLFARRVDLVFEVINMRVTDNGELGFDWNVVYKTLGDAVVKAGRVISPATLTSNTAGAIGLSASGGRWDGSSLLIKALSEVGTVVSTTRVPIQTTNRRPASYAVRSTFNYIDQVTGAGQAGALSATTATGPTVTQKDETVGTILTIVPDVADDGVVSMSVSFDNTSLVKLEPFVVGAGTDSEVTVQQKVIDGAGVLQQVTTRVGVPTVVGGFERNTQEATARRLDKGAPLLAGGSDRAKNQRDVTVLMVTAVAKDGI